MIEVKDEAGFDAAIKSGIVLVEFWAPWCGPCRAMAKTMDAVEEQVAGKAVVVKVDVEACPELAGRHGVRGIPMVVMFKDGKRVMGWVGLRKPDEIVRAALDAAGG